MCIIFHRILGNSSISPKRINITADIMVSVLGYIPNWSTRSFIISVNTNTDSAKDAIIIYGRDFLPSMTDPPIITGSSGNTHGASIVNSPATNDNIIKLMIALRLLIKDMH